MNPRNNRAFPWPLYRDQWLLCEVARDVQGSLSKPTAKPSVISVGSTDESAELDKSFLKSCEVEIVIEEEFGGEGEIDDRDCSPSQQCRGRR